MSKIKIIATPPGFASQYIREAWIGVSIPLPTPEQFAEDPPSGVSIGNENEGGFLVLTSEAVLALKEMERYDAYNFWSRMNLGRYLRFKKEVCEIIEE